jgi:hypothetical protein
MAAQLHQQARCSATTVVLGKVGRWGSQQRWPTAVERRKRPARWRSKAAAELWWPGRVSMSPAAGGGDKVGEARSERDGRRGRDRAH